MQGFWARIREVHSPKTSRLLRFVIPIQQQLVKMKHQENASLVLPYQYIQ